MTALSSQKTKPEVEAPEAIALPQCVGLLQPTGSVVYMCAGRRVPGEPFGRCSNMLFAWIPPASDVDGMTHGRIEAKCRRCRTLNVIVLDASLVR